MKQEKNIKTKARKLKDAKNSNKGITLIALVITIVVLLILAAVSIATLTGENGILTRANEAKEATEQAKKDELEMLNDLNNIMENYTETTEGFDGEVNSPKLSSGMIAVKYENGKWLKADESNKNNSWYDYGKDAKKWANVVTVKDDKRKEYTNASENTEIKMEDITTMFVWIPRYSYEISYTDASNKNAGGKITVSFLQGNTNKEESGNTTNRQVPKSVTTTEEYEEGYGYYRIVVNGEETGRYDVWHWHMRRVTKDNTVQVIMEPYLIEVTEFPVICEYSLESSNYEKKFELTYMGRKDMGVKKIAEKNQFDNLDFGIYTIAGDVSITIEGDMVYSLEDALKQGVIKVQDILEQAKQDEKYRFCEEAYYQDGGSTEYRYAEYTILKYNTLDGNKDLVIGMQGSIINQMNASGYRAE